MTTIPASQIVNVLPSVLAAGGNQLDLIGLVITQNTRVPIGTVQPFVNPTAVSAYFGPNATETLYSNVYFTGFTNADGVPGQMLVAQMPVADVAAYLRSSSALSLLTIPQLQSINGTLAVVMDGYTRSGTVNLASATSFSAAGTLIANALNQTPTTLATASGSIGPQSSSFVGSISGNVLTVTTLNSGTIVPGGSVTGSGVLPNTKIATQLSIASGNAGGLGTYAVNNAQAVNNVTFTHTYGLMTIASVSFGTISSNQLVNGTGVVSNTQVIGLGTGLGLTGTYFVSNAQTIGSITLTFTPVPVTCTFDSVLGALNILSGFAGGQSSAAFATGAASSSLFLTQSTGAVVSQGSEGLTPAAFMNGVTAVTEDWATFMTIFDPDLGNGYNQKLAFSTWASQAPQNQSFVYIASDADPNPTLTVPATSSFGYALQQGNYTATCLIYQPAEQFLTAFVSGVTASIKFNELNGRITFAFRNQTGLTASVTNAQVAQNLIANGYNFYGAYATANQQFTFLYPGSISGPFTWMDSFINQIWMNHQFQLSLMVLLTQNLSIPYNPDGYALIETALAGNIDDAKNFGAFRAGVSLSATQIAKVNAQAGVPIDNILTQRGWYLQVTDPGALVRQQRGSPICKFWYTDGEAVQQIVLSSIDLL